MTPPGALPAGIARVRSLGAPRPIAKWHTAATRLPLRMSTLFAAPNEAAVPSVYILCRCIAV